jgi:hypothetical protein
MRARRRLGVALAAGCLAAALLPGAASATNTSGALISQAECNENNIPRNDDSFSSAVDMPFAVDFYGQRYDTLWVNNNGNITFDGPLSTFTPFGLKATSAAIIAPFFADVDTRAAGSDTVKYGWGTTTFEGKPAFCANWIDVGYYNQHADKLNSFQLLLVKRPELDEGDFDIVFNYGTVNWETGDASDGVGGLGGESARVGFSNGDGTDVNSYELSGSGIDGTLLDSNFSRGLVHNSIGSEHDGRYVFRIRNGVPAPNSYVAMGDSYQSGEGAGNYDPDTDRDGVNQCHRSRDAYAERLVRDGVVPYELDFVACSGAEMPDLTDFSLSTTGPPWNEGAQFSHLDESTALSTLGIGGNDLGFGPTLGDCIRNHYFGDSCQEVFDAEITDRLIELQSHGFDGLNAFQRVYDDARSRAWRARTLVLGYPRFFTQDGGEDWTGGPFGHRCQSLRLSDQVWINFKIRQLNTAIEASARSMGAEFVDLYDVPDGVELCSGADPTFMNGALPTNQVESFHPNAFGQGLIADELSERFGQDPPPADKDFTIFPDEIIEFFEDLGDDFLGGSFGIDWPGSDVEMTLTSPSGVVYSRDSLPGGVYHRNGQTQELYRIPNPEKGRWRVKLYGKDVRSDGEPVRFNFYGEERPNQNPVAGIKITKTSKNTIRAQATGSFDPDGTVVDYLWDFGDETVATGPDVTHRFAEEGSYRVTLIAKDDEGGLGFATADTRFELVPYAFSGFKAPVEDRPVVNSVKAGSAVPVKFSLGGPQGLTIFDAGFPKAQKVDCRTGAEVNEVTDTVTAGGSSLSYDAITDTYHYVWKTDKAWAGSCRRLVLGLNDSSTQSADFRLK